MRRSLQGPIAAALLVAGGLAGIAILLGSGRRGRPPADRALVYAIYAAGLMVLLVMLRVVSFHATDRLLYAPLRLNWVLDPGASLVVGWAAWRYARVSAVR